MRHITPGEGPRKLGRHHSMDTGRHANRSNVAKHGPMHSDGRPRHNDKTRYKHGGMIGTGSPHRASGKIGGGPSSGGSY